MIRMNRIFYHINFPLLHKFSQYFVYHIFIVQNEVEDVKENVEVKQQL